MKQFTNTILNFFRKIFFSQTKTVYYTEPGTGKKSQKIKIKHHIPLIKKIFSGNEQLITAIVVLSLLLGLWFLYIVFGTWDVAKFAARIDQDQEIELPGKNPFDKKK
jgi:hypothetical protein